VENPSYCDVDVLLKESLHSFFFFVIIIFFNISFYIYWAESWKPLVSFCAGRSNSIGADFKTE